ncbi:MAG: hypothetical protein IT340_19990 [Chloroflexi bacterium]|nr:hypothetical protein [Chloroflexota bacterium]
MATLPYGLRSLRSDEIVLFDKRWPIHGPVHSRIISPFAPKTTVGEHSRQDRVVESEWVMSDFSGGLGVMVARPNQDDDRYGIGTVDTGHRFIMLGPEQVQAGSLASVTHLMDYRGDLYAVTANNTVWKWSHFTSGWVQETNGNTVIWNGSATLIDGTVTCVATAADALYVLTTTELFRKVAGGTWETQAVGGYALCAHLDRLYRLDGNNNLHWTDPDGTWTTWTAAGSLALRPGWCKQLLVFFDQAGESALHAVTAVGVYGYDDAAARFWPLFGMEWPYQANAVSGACVWQGSLYCPVGAGIRKYNGAVVQPVGPDKDDGLPAYLRGPMRAVLAGHSYLFALVQADATAAVIAWDALWDVAHHTWDESMAVVPATGAVMQSAGVAWWGLPYPPDGSGSTALPPTDIACAHVAGLSDSYRCWYATASGVYYFDLETGLHNPLQSSRGRKAPLGVLETARQDLRWAEKDKRAFSLDLQADLPTGATVVVELRFDGGEWQAGLTATATGQTRVQLSETGLVFRTVAMRMTVTRGSDATQTPVIYSLSLGYRLLSGDLHAVSVTLDLTTERCKALMNMTPGAALRLLKTLKRSGVGGNLAYRNEGQEPETLHVVVGEVGMAETPGSPVTVRADVSLLEIDT